MRDGSIHGEKIIARRDLVWVADDGTRLPLTISLLRPVQGERAFSCGFEIQGLGSRLDRTDEDVFSLSAMGIDELQAVSVALDAISMVLRPHEPHLAWGDGSAYHGLPAGTDS